MKNDNDGIIHPQIVAINDTKNGENQSNNLLLDYEWLFFGEQKNKKFYKTFLLMLNIK